ncbi:MAG: pilus assembly FimT family protein [Thermoanaerobaculia bacterium]
MTAGKGFQLLELVTVLAVLGLVVTLGVPPLLQTTSRQRLHLAAGQITTVLQQARQTAIRFTSNVGLALELRPDGDLDLRLYRDGDGDGVHRDDIEQGVDVELPFAPALSRPGRAVRPGFPEGPPPRDPGDPTRRLDRLDDPIRFGRSDLAVFTSLGTATPGTIYLTDGRHLLAVRVLGTTARIRVLEYDPETETWN